jgi:hypothetical protein
VTLQKSHFGNLRGFDQKDPEAQWIPRNVLNCSSSDSASLSHAGGLVASLALKNGCLPFKVSYAFAAVSTDGTSTRALGSVFLEDSELLEAGRADWHGAEA